MVYIDTKALALARAHGSFCLRFDAVQNCARSDDRPWTVEVGSVPDRR